MNTNIFRAYDIRGIADKDLTDEVVEKIGRAFGTKMIRKKNKVVTVGRDVRLSSHRIQQAMMRGILSSGLDVIDVGVLPTPVLYFSIVHFKTDGSVMVTGSHNPIEFNGLKMNDGMLSIYGDQIQQLREMVEQEDFETGSGSLTQKEIVTDYQKMLQERIQIRRPFKIVIDSGNGRAGPVLACRSRAG